MGLFTKKTLEVRDVDGPAAGVVPPAINAVSAVSVEQALSIGAVYRAVSIITSAISQMPLGVFRNGVEIDTPSIIKSPNVDATQRQFIKETVWCLVTHGNAYWRVYGSPVANLSVLEPTSVAVNQDPSTGKKTYWYNGAEVRNIKHLRLESRPGQPYGTGPIQRGARELYGALKIREFADNWFGAGIPEGYLTTDQTLNAKQAAELVEAWKKFVQEHGTAVMSNGVDYKHLQVKPADAQMLEIQQANTVAVARLFGVPATLLMSGNEGNSNTYSNQQELFIQFLQTTLVEYMNEIEDAFSSILPRGQQVEFKEDALLRMNTQMEVEVQAAQIAAGIKTINEVRAEMSLPPINEKEVSSPNDEEPEA